MVWVVDDMSKVGLVEVKDKEAILLRSWAAVENERSTKPTRQTDTRTTARLSERTIYLCSGRRWGCLWDLSSLYCRDRARFRGMPHTVPIYLQRTLFYKRKTTTPLDKKKGDAELRANLI